MVHVEIQLDTISKSFNLWTDDQNLIAALNVSMTGSPFKTAELGFPYSWETSNAIVYIDDVVISDVYIGSSTTYTLTISSGTGGTTNPVAGTYEIAADTQQQVTATPSTGYTFDHWLLDSTNVGSTNPYNLLMNGDHTIQPVFTSSTYTLTVSAGSNGTTNPTVGTYNITAGTYQQISATPETGYSFEHWILDSVDAGSANPYNLLMNSNHTIQPVFTTSSEFISSIAADAPFTVTSGALSLNTSAPMQISSNTLTVPQASATTDGYLSSSNWNTFNSKQNALTTGNLTGTNLSVTGGTGAVIGSGVSLSIPQAIDTNASPTFTGLKYFSQFDIYNDNGTAITGVMHIDDEGKVTIGGNAQNAGQLKLFNNSNPENTNPAPETVPMLDSIEIVTKIWWFEDGHWAPPGLAHGDSYLRLSNKDETLFTNVFEIICTPDAPLLATDTGLVVQKDISCGGFVSSNQGELWLGSGRDDQVDVPKIILGNATCSRLGGGGIFSINPVPSSDTSFPSKENGKVAIREDAYDGNPENTLYKYNATTDHWDPMGPTTNYAGNFDTLYLRKLLVVDGNKNVDEPANLDVGDLTVHGSITALGTMTDLVVHLASIIDTSLQIVGGFLGISPSAAQTFDSLTLSGNLTVNGSSTVSNGLTVQSTNNSYITLATTNNSSWILNSYSDGKFYIKTSGLEQFIFETNGDLSIGGNLNVSGKIYSANFCQAKMTFWAPTYTDWMTYLANDAATFPDWTHGFQLADNGSYLLSMGLIGVIFDGSKGFPSGIGETILCSHNLTVKKDFFAKGQVCSLEGCLTMYGGRAGWVTGGVFNTNNPIVMLADSSYGRNALEIRTFDGGYGGLKAGVASLYGLNLTNPSISNVTASRQLSVDRDSVYYSYTNNSGRAMLVHASVGLTACGANGYYVSTIVLGFPSGYEVIAKAQNDYCTSSNSFTFLVPHGWHYQIKDSSPAGHTGGVTLESVQEILL